MTAAFLYCSDPLNPRRIDPHFASEAQVVRELGGTVALIDHDSLLAGQMSAAVARVPVGFGSAWYRGWMIPTAVYARFAAALESRGARLLTAAEDYSRAHELPGWYATFADVTPRSVWLPSSPGVVPTPSELAALVAPLGSGPGLLKDYVKSRKHEWQEARFVPQLSDTGGLHRVASRFVELQEDFLAGGVVVRAFEQFDTTRSGAGEARVWWVDGDPVLIGPHPDTPQGCPTPELDRVHTAVRALGCRFVTTDVAQRVDGEWRVIEVGDGQVSDLPRGLDPKALIRTLLDAGAARN